MAGYAIVPDIDAPELTGTDIAVWAALCRYAQWEMEHGKPVRSKAGTCFPSLSGLAKTARLGHSTICRSLQKLERLGYITRMQSRNNDVYANTEYLLHPERIEGSPTVGQRVVPQWDKGSPTVGQGGSPTVGHKHTHIYNIPIEQEAAVKAAAESPAGVSLAQVLALWNAQLGPIGFPTVMKGTPARQRAFQARLNESPERRTLGWWETLMARIKAAEFLVSSAKEKKRWLNFDWILNESNMVKILEGRYDRERATPDSPQQPPQTSAQMSYEEAEALYGYSALDAIDVEAKEISDDTRTGLQAFF